MGRYIPTLMFSQTFLFFMYAMNWFRAARSRIFDIAGSKETGRLLFADSRSPSFESGTTSSDNFQEAGNTEDNLITTNGSLCQLMLVRYTIKRP